MNPRFAGRLIPARADVAAEHLRGQVEAARYAAGEARRVAVTLLDLTAVADPEAERATQLVYGEVFTVYEERPDGLAWGQVASFLPNRPSRLRLRPPMATSATCAPTGWRRRQAAASG